jgi:simple sugar transport system permease protein
MNANVKQLIRWRWLILSTAVLAAAVAATQLFGLRAYSLLETALLAMTPLALAAIGESLNEQAGTINVGIEGIFLITAVSGVYWAEVFNNGLAGVMLGGVMGAALGFFLGIITAYGKADQVISGIGINLFALGLVPFLLFSIWGFPGIHIFPQQLMVPPFRFIVSVGLFNVNPITLATIVIGILAYLFLYRTLIGIRIRAAGENPIAVDVAGLDVNRIRLMMSTLGGALAGLGGAFMPLGWFGGLVKEISAGRGFIALSAVVFAGLNPLLALAAALLFGVSEAVAVVVVVSPGLRELVPFYFVQMIPYVVTLVVLTAAVGRKRFPRAIGRPYIRE